MDTSPDDEPCFLTPEDDESMLDPPTEPTEGPPWWDGRWPEGGIHSLDDLGEWIDDRLDTMVVLARSKDFEPLRPIGLMLGRQAVKNAIRYLARTGKTAPPDRPGDDELEHIEAIEGAMEGILRYIRRERSSDVVTAIEQHPEKTGGGHAGGSEAGGRSALSQRSWTQVDLDAAIYKFVADRAAAFNDLVEGVKKGLEGAKREARRLYGRNALSDTLGVKARAMVSKSPAWVEIANKLQLPRHQKGGESKFSRMGLDIALEKHAERTSEAPEDVAVKAETVKLIQKRMPREAAEAMVDRLIRGDLSDEDAREIVQMHRPGNKDH